MISSVFLTFFSNYSQLHGLSFTKLCVAPVSALFGPLCSTWRPCETRLRHRLGRGVAPLLNLEVDPERGTLGATR